MSSILHGILILASIIVIPNILNLIPLASLAAILLVVGYKLAKPALFVQMYKNGGSVFIPFIVTVLGLIFTDLLIGICLGLAIGIIQILWNNYRLPYHFDPNTYKVGKPVVIKLSQEVTFLNKASIFKTLHGMPNGTHVIIDESQNNYIHPDVEEIFEEFAERANQRNIKFERFNRESSFDSDSVDKLNTAVQKQLAI